MARPGYQWEAAMDILSFMEKHEVDEEEMTNLIYSVLDLTQDEDFIDFFCVGGPGNSRMNHIRNIANEEHDDAD